jgi:uncharacterized protein with HEPN domain
MNEDRLSDYLDQMATAAGDASHFVKSMSREEFRADKRTQQAVIMSLIIIGEAAARIMDQYGDFVAAHSAIPWRGMRGMRNRIAHGYFDVNLEIVWETVQAALPELSRHLRQLRGRPPGAPGLPPP